MHTRPRSKLPDRPSRDPSSPPVLPCSGDWTRVVSIPRAHSGHSQRDAVGAINIRCSSPHHAVRVMQHVSVWWRIVAISQYEGVCVWEVLVVEVVKFGERGVKQGEIPLEIGALI